MGGEIKMDTFPMRSANAFALATAVIWVLCSVVVWLFPAFSWQVYFY